MPAIPEWFKIIYTLARAGVHGHLLAAPRAEQFPLVLRYRLHRRGAGHVAGKRLLSGVLACMVLLPEVLWNVDYGLRLALRRRITGLTEYMFDPSIPRWLRGCRCSTCRCRWCSSGWSPPTATRRSRWRPAPGPGRSCWP
jgi:hypothetical protein